MKRIMSIQDISCIGKCSLTVALPIISATGIETAIVPTAILSTHTMFSNFTFRDLTDDLDSIKEHWKNEGFKFEAIYSGYLGSDRQIAIVSDYIDTFKQPGTKVIVDPAMADNGKLYAGFDSYFAAKMKNLCQKADIILPNISEAAILTDSEYPGEDASEEIVKDLLIKLSKLGAKLSVITGITFNDGTFGFYGYNSETDEYLRFGTKKISIRSHGTGDIFASTLTGALANGIKEYDALVIASKYTSKCIENSFNDPYHVNYGVNFELELPYLMELIKNAPKTN